ncbi:hypothetical protein BH23ACT11_BH23ACT11_13660 [soil metagenome]
MIGELWQFLIALFLGIAAILLWIFVVYIPRRRWDGDGNKTSKKPSDDHQT